MRVMNLKLKSLRVEPEGLGFRVECSGFTSHRRRRRPTLSLRPAGAPGQPSNCTVVALSPTRSPLRSVRHAGGRPRRGAGNPRPTRRVRGTRPGVSSTRLAAAAPAGPPKTGSPPSERALVTTGIHDAARRGPARPVPPGGGRSRPGPRA